jgi:acyl-CoA thioesterase FadM
VLLGVSRIGASSVTWDFEVLNAAGEIAAFGSMTNVRVDREGRSQEITAAERAAIQGEAS